MAQVVDCITPDYPPQDSRAIMFLKDLTLACGRVDILRTPIIAQRMSQSPPLTEQFGPGTPYSVGP